MDIPVYVISLKRSVERRNHAIDQLNSLNVPFQIIEAVDGYELSDQEIQTNSDYWQWKFGSRTRHPWQGEIGCVLSHFKIFLKMIAEDIQAACILEDDTDLMKDFKIFLNYENLELIDWDLFYIGHHSKYSKREAQSKNKKELKIRNYTAGEPIEPPMGSYGYIIKKNAAVEILKYGYPIRKPFDQYIGNAPALGIRTVILSPVCVSHNYLFSTTIYPSSSDGYSSFIELFRRQIRKSYKWFPFLQSLRIWINVNMYQSVIFLRKIGLLKNSYAKFD